MSEIEEYHILTLPDPDKLEQAVNRGIAEGYQPLGGIAISVMLILDQDGAEQSVSMFSQAIGKLRSPIQRLN